MCDYTYYDFGNTLLVYGPKNIKESIDLSDHEVSDGSVMAVGSNNICLQALGFLKKYLEAFDEAHPERWSQEDKDIIAYVTLAKAGVLLSPTMLDCSEELFVEVVSNIRFGTILSGVVQDDYQDEWEVEAKKELELCHNQGQFNISYLFEIINKVTKQMQNKYGKEWRADIAVVDDLIFEHTIFINQLLGINGTHLFYAIDFRIRNGGRAYMDGYLEQCINSINNYNLDIMGIIDDISDLEDVQKAYEHLVSGHNSSVKLLTRSNK